MARILVVFSSLFGANAELAGLIRPVLARTGAQTRLRGVAQHVLAGHMAPSAKSAITATAQDLEWADGFVFTSPVHTGLLSASLKAFIDENHDAAETGTFVDKTFTAMATGAYDHSGQERVVDELNTVGAVWGCVLIPPSGADAALNHQNGNPWGLSFGLRHGRIADQDSATSVLQTHLSRFAAITEAMAAVRSARRKSGSVSAFSHQPNREGGSMYTPTNPMRATQVFTSPGSKPPVSRSPGSGTHTPSDPLRATQVFTGPSVSGGGASRGSRSQSSGSGRSAGSGGSGRSGRSGSSGSSGGSRSTGQRGTGGHSPTNPLRVADVFGSLRKNG